MKGYLRNLNRNLRPAKKPAQLRPRWELESLRRGGKLDLIKRKKKEKKVFPTVLVQYFEFLSNKKTF